MNTSHRLFSAGLFAVILLMVVFIIAPGMQPQFDAKVQNVSSSSSSSSTGPVTDQGLTSLKARAQTALATAKPILAAFDKVEGDYMALNYKIQGMNPIPKATMKQLTALSQAAGSAQQATYAPLQEIYKVYSLAGQILQNRLTLLTPKQQEETSPVNRPIGGRYQFLTAQNFKTTKTTGITYSLVSATDSAGNLIDPATLPTYMTFDTKFGLVTFLKTGDYNVTVKVANDKNPNLNDQITAPFHIVQGPPETPATLTATFAALINPAKPKVNYSDVLQGTHAPWQLTKEEGKLFTNMTKVNMMGTPLITNTTNVPTTNQCACAGNWLLEPNVFQQPRPELHAAFIDPVKPIFNIAPTLGNESFMGPVIFDVLGVWKDSTTRTPFVGGKGSKDGAAMDGASYSVAPVSESVITAWSAMNKDVYQAALQKGTLGRVTRDLVIRVFRDYGGRNTLTDFLPDLSDFTNPDWLMIVRRMAQVANTLTIADVQ